MPHVTDLSVLHEQMIQWRHYLHRHPETGFEEFNTSCFAADVLREMGLEVITDIGGTGFVANLYLGSGSVEEPVVAIRADMDALAIHEQVEGREYQSCHSGKMHACGHDGHMSMVLGAAKLLSDQQKANPQGYGTVRFIFQPAEEHGKGAKAMIRDGVFERFPTHAIFGAHNMPGIPAGHFATRAGGIMASEDNFEIIVHGKGAHAARPHMGIDPLVIGAEIVLALQHIVARNVDPADSAVISCTEFHADGIRNATPSKVVITGDTRSYSPTVQALLEHRMREVAEGIAQAHGAQVEFSYTHEFAPTVNSPEYVDVAVTAARRVEGITHVDANIAPMMISEDFGAFLDCVPGNFIFIGNGTQEGEGGTPLHNATYDFNDDVLILGAQYFAEVAQVALDKLSIK